MAPTFLKISIFNNIDYDKYQSAFLSPLNNLRNILLLNFEKGIVLTKSSYHGFRTRHLSFYLLIK